MKNGLVILLALMVGNVALADGCHVFENPNTARKLSAESKQALADANIFVESDKSLATAEITSHVDRNQEEGGCSLVTTVENEAVSIEVRSPSRSKVLGVCLMSKKKALKANVEELISDSFLSFCKYM